MQLKLFGALAVVLLIGGLLFYQSQLKTTIAEQKAEIVKYEADVDKLVKEIEYRKLDAVNLEKGISSLQIMIDDTKKECAVQAASIEKKYQLLLKRQFTATKKLIDGGAIDEKTSTEFIDHFNSRYFAN